MNKLNRKKPISKSIMNGLRYLTEVMVKKEASSMEISPSLSIQPLQLEHANALLRCVDGSRASLAMTMPWEKKLHSVSDARYYILARVSQRDKGALWYAIMWQGQFVGVFGVKYIDKKHKCSELGYWLADSARGKGIISRIFTQVFPYLKQTHQVSVVEFHCLESNLAGIRVVEKAGASLSGTIPNTMDVPNPTQKLNVYKLKL